MNRQLRSQGLVPAIHKRQAKDLLATDDAAWQVLRPMMETGTEAEFIALHDGGRAGIPPEDPIDPAEVQNLFALLADPGGDDRIAAGLFWQGEWSASSQAARTGAGILSVMALLMALGALADDAHTMPSPLVRLAYG